MRNLIPLLALALLLIAGDEAYGQQKNGMRDVVTSDELSRKLRMAQQSDPIRQIGPPAGNVEEDPAKAVTSRDLIKSSTILCFRGFLTLVPKQSVLHVPENLADRIGEKPDIKVQTFRDFQLANRSWIRTVEVTREQALGHTPLNENITATFEKSPYLVIATYKGGPISVLPLKAPEEVPDPSEMKSVIYRK